MNLRAFRCRIPGKWVLTGEHSVLRGATAVAMPHPDAYLDLAFEPSTHNDLEIEPPRARTVIVEMLQSIAKQVPDFDWPRGRLHIESTIPVGAGLGSSAALCVAMTRWLSQSLKLPDAQFLEFARKLENRFHGKSSGMDIAATSSGEPIAFSMSAGAEPLSVAKLPRFTFHDTGDRARTADCIARVEKFRQENPGEASVTDQLMSQAGQKGIEGLRRFSSGEAHDVKEGLKLVAQAMTDAQACFEKWRLVPASAQALIEKLMRQGALATKLTGAGGGGFVVALWET